MEASGEGEDKDGGTVDFPIMHWEELSARIQELEQDQDQDRSPQRAAVWEEDHEEQRKNRLTSRLQKRLRVCFVNDGDSEDEGGAKEQVSTVTGPDGRHGSGLKQEVVTTLRTLRDKRLDELRRETVQVCLQTRSLSRSQLQIRTLQQLLTLRTSLQKDTHGLSAELVSQLLIRDQLRTKQDALLLDLLDLT